MKKIIKILIIIMIVFFSTNIKADYDFVNKESHYLKLCATSSGFRDNKVTCEAFESYLEQKSVNSDKQASDIKDKVATVKGDIEKLVALVAENEALITSYENKIKELEGSIKAKEEEIVVVEDDLIQRIGLMQEISVETIVYDFTMGSISLEQFLGQVDALNAINESNKDIMNDLDGLKTDLVVEKEESVSVEANLVESKKNQEIMIKDLQKQQADLIAKLTTAENNKKMYDSKLDGLNIEDIVSEVKPNNPPNTPSEPTTPTNPGDPVVTPPPSGATWILPVPSGTGYISSVAWYYEGTSIWHPAVDFASPYNTSIVAPANGVILVSGWTNNGLGNMLVTAHQYGNDTYIFIYGHMNSPGRPAGTVINQGNQIGYVGNTGNSFGAHLHLEMLKLSGMSLANTISTYQYNRDYMFGLNYYSTGNCSSVCRLSPNEFYGLSMYQRY